MSLLFVDGFDYYDNTAQLEKKWTNREGGSWSSTAGRFGEGGLSLFIGSNTGEFVRKTVSERSELILGFAFHHVINDSLSGGLDIAAAGHVNDRGADLRINEDGSFSIHGDSEAAVSAEAIHESQWYYVEWRVDFGDQTTELRVNEEAYISATSATFTDSDDNTMTTGNWCKLAGENNQIVIPEAFGTFDDPYIIDTHGSQNNDFLGDVKVETLLPDSDETVEWVPDSGNTNYQMVDDESLDTDNTFNSSDTQGNTDQFSFTDLADNPNDVNAVAMSAVGQKTDAGTVGIKNFVRVNSSNSTASEQLLTSDYLYEQSIFPNQPSGSSWTGNPINQMSAGYHHSS